MGSHTISIQQGADIQAALPNGVMREMRPQFNHQSNNPHFYPGGPSQTDYPYGVRTDVPNIMTYKFFGEASTTPIGSTVPEWYTVLGNLPNGTNVKAFTDSFWIQRAVTKARWENAHPLVLDWTKHNALAINPQLNTPPAYEPYQVSWDYIDYIEAEETEWVQDIYKPTYRTEVTIFFKSKTMPGHDVNIYIPVDQDIWPMHDDFYNLSQHHI